MLGLLLLGDRVGAPPQAKAVQWSLNRLLLPPDKRK